MRPSRYPARKVPIREAEQRGISSKDLTRRQLYLYIFGGAIRGFYILGCLFLDSMIPVAVLNLVYSDTYGMGIFRPISLGTSLLAAYLTLLIALLEVALIFYQARYWRRGLRKLGRNFQVSG